MSEEAKLNEVVNLPVDRETMARQNGFTAAYGARTWDDIVRDFYNADPSISRLDEENVRNGLEHVLQMTGETEATMDPTLSRSLNRIV